VATSNREPPEAKAKMTHGREALRRVQDRNTLSEDEAIELGVKAVHEARRERRAAGRDRSEDVIDRYSGCIDTGGTLRDHIDGLRDEWS
jgi:hypothetical protein